MNRAIFYQHVRLSLFSGNLLPAQFNGIEAILDEWDRRKLTTNGWLAYMLATTFWETGRTMQPVREVGGARARYAPYYGRGFVQLTWGANYKKAGKIIGVDLYGNPDRALELPIATTVMFDGMIDGWFTGKKLSTYISATSHDFIGARRIINGQDKATQIAIFAESFLAAIETAETGVSPATGTPVTLHPSIEQPSPKPKPASPVTDAAKAAAVAIAGVAAPVAQHGFHLSFVIPLAIVAVTSAAVYVFRHQIAAAIGARLPSPALAAVAKVAAPQPVAPSPPAAPAAPLSEKKA